jgi:GrpB-like predicted nucleotidyltransferase (UPF0157 family)
MEKLPSRPVHVIDYDPAWAAIFLKSRDRLWPLVHDVARAIEHVGSTAVPGLAAKPIIDVDIVVESLTVVPPLARRLETVGYTMSAIWVSLAGKHSATRSTEHIIYTPARTDVMHSGTISRCGIICGVIRQTSPPIRH